jgi:hypothetical protein
MTNKNAKPAEVIVPLPLPQISPPARAMARRGGRNRVRLRVRRPAVA